MIDQMLINAKALERWYWLKVHAKFLDKYLRKRKMELFK